MAVLSAAFGGLVVTRGDDEQSGAEETPLCASLTAEGARPVPAGSWVDTVEHLDGGRVRVVFTRRLQMPAVPVSDDEFVVSASDLADAVCEDDQLPLVVACRTSEPVPFHLVRDEPGEPDGFELQPGEWAWLRFVHRGWAFAYDAFGFKGWTPSGPFDCCPAYDGESLPQPWDTVCLPELR